MSTIEIVPAILRTTFEKLHEDWRKVYQAADHVQIDVTDGIFAGDGTFRDLKRLKQLEASDKIELHMMVHTPANFIDEIIDLSPARLIFHVESFAGTGDLRSSYQKLRGETQAELALAINPESPNQWLDEHVDLIDFVLFMGYNPGWANQPINELVFNKLRTFTERHPDKRIAADGHVGKDTIERFVQAGATMLCANTAIFGHGDPVENIQQLKLLAESAQ